MNTTPLYPQIGEGDCDGDGYNYALTDNNKGDNDNYHNNNNNDDKNNKKDFLHLWYYMHTFRYWVVSHKPDCELKLWFSKLFKIMNQ